MIDRIKARDLYRSGHSLTETGRLLGVTRQRVQQILIDLGEPRRGSTEGGGRNRHPGLTAQQMDRIAALRQGGASWIAVAKELGMCRATLMDILGGTGPERGPRPKPAKDHIACCRCNQSLPATTEHFPPSIIEKGAGYCRACQREYYRDYRLAYRNAFNPVLEGSS